MDEDFLSLSEDNWFSELCRTGLTPYDDNLLYREQKIADRRYCLAFNRQLWQDTRTERNERLSKARHFFAEMNLKLQGAQKSRDLGALRRGIDAKLKKLKLHKAITYQIHPVEIIRQTASGRHRAVSSYRVEHQVHQEALDRMSRLDGILCFISNETAEKLPAADIISYYRRKNTIEEAFREMKDYLKLRPIYLSREKRVKAHVSICVLAYLLLNTIEQKLRAQGQPFQAPQALQQLGRCLLNRLGPKGSKKSACSITEPTPEQLQLLQGLDCSHLVYRRFLNPLLKTYHV